jgi:two-component system, chemotaxis family, sensor kinase CheA
MSDSFSELDEIIADFIQESRDMIDQLEPTIIELGQSCHAANCWETLSCDKSDCVRHGQKLDFPCWLQAGFIGDGDQTCLFSDSEESCKKCQVFEETNGNGETMNAIFRLFHSMKGSAGFLELNNISGVAHMAENLLDRIRAGKIKMQNDHVDLLCQSCDFAKEALDHLENNGDDTAMADQAEAMKQLLENAVTNAQEAAEGNSPSDSQQKPEEEVAQPAPESPPENDLNSLEDLISPEMINNFVLESEELLQNLEQGLLKWSETPESIEIVSDIFRNVHSFKGNCGFFGFQDPENLTHHMETLLDAVREGSQVASENPGELLLGYLDVIKTALADISQGGKGEIEDLENHVQAIKDLAVPRFGEIMVEKGLVEKETIDEVLEKKNRPVGDFLVEMGKVTQDQVEEALDEQKQKKNSPPATIKTPVKTKAPNASAKRQDIRVDLGKLDDLINVIGEMVIAENMLVNNPDIQDLELENFNKAAQQMGKLIRELQEMAMTIRMIPVSGLFKRMIRLVHDLSAKSGKKVELKLIGEETEVDKTVIETITDPLVHLLRNSLDHGLETPDERINNGKPEKGVVKLSARHEEGEVWIIVEDDGRGLNREKILAKAISQGLIQGDGSDMPDKAIFGLIFHAGFSTAEKITDVSGRGVGMDVVKQNLDKIKGKIEVQSQQGQGTQLKLRIPLTLAIIDGMLVRVGKTKCIVPLIAIREIIRPSSKDITVTPNGQELAKIREKFFPIRRLSDVLGKSTDCEKIEDSVLVVMEDQGNSFCLQVDEILGQQQTVIKGLSDYIGNVRGISGCTILGNGDVCLILDIGSLVEMEYGEQLQASNA